MKDSGGRPRLVLAELWCRPIGILLVAWVTPNLLAVAVIHRIFTLPAMGVLLHAGLLLGLLFWLALLPWAGRSGDYPGFCSPGSAGASPGSCPSAL